MYRLNISKSRGIIEKAYEDDFSYYLTYISYNQRKATKNKLSFESVDFLLDYLFIIIREYQDKNWTVFPVHKFKDL